MRPKAKKTATYIRVAICDDMAAKASAQHLDCIRWIQANATPAGQYEDIGVDGMTVIRDGLEQLFEDAYLGLFNQVVMQHPTVLARGAQTVERLKERFRRAGIEIVYVHNSGADVNIDPALRERARAKIGLGP